MLDEATARGLSGRGDEGAPSETMLGEQLALSLEDREEALSRTAVSLDGRLIDIASIRQAEALLNKAAAMGM